MTLKVLIVCAVGILSGCAMEAVDETSDVVDVDVRNDDLDPQSASRTTATNQCVCYYGHVWCRRCSTCGWYSTSTPC